jgi:isocitrate dehydrogenase
MKDNIMKMTDGLFHKVFDEIAAQYPDIQKEAWIVDIGAAKLADTPEAFDVVVLPNLYGDILSDVAAQIAGSVGLAGSANIGDKCAMFEAIHGSAPRRAGQNLANPSGLLLGAVLMLVHINLPETAALVQNAWLRTIEDGIHTYDIFTEGVSTAKVGTKEFAEAVVARLGQQPNQLKPVSYAHKTLATAAAPAAAMAANGAGGHEIRGVDLFVTWPSRNPHALAAAMQPIASDELKLDMIDNRGVKVWPNGSTETFCTESFRCRFLAEGATGMQPILALCGRVSEQGIEIAATQTLRTFAGKAGYSLAQGQ